MISSESAEALRLLVVCVGNHCRSPLGEAVLARHGGHTVAVRSAGLVDKHTNRPAHPMMIVAADELGYDLRAHRGRHLTPDLLDWADLILVMDRSIGSQVEALSSPVEQAKIQLFVPDTDVPDPWGKSPSDFAACAAMIAADTDRHLP